MRLLPLFRALRFHTGSTAELEAVQASEWPQLLRSTDREGITLALGARCRGSLPRQVQARIDRNMVNNAKRHVRLIEAQREIAIILERQGIEFAVLKGLSQWPYYTENPQQRPQYDIDIYCPRHSLHAALAAVRTLGYEAWHDRDSHAADHLPVMIRKTGWTWRDDYYDPDMPPALELHFRFWDQDTERFDVADVGQFWKRRVVRNVGGLLLPTLSLTDGLSYSAMHLVRHLFRGNLRIQHVYELAHFLERSASDDALWSAFHPMPLEAIAFRLAREWFGCQMNPAASDAVARLSPLIKRWFDLFAFSPATAIDQPNKNELWLHLCLVSGTRQRCGLARSRLFPVQRTRVLLDAHLPPAQISLPLRLRRIFYEGRFIAGRAVHHLRTMIPMVISGLRWWRARSEVPHAGCAEPRDRSDSRHYPETSLP